MDRVAGEKGKTKQRGGRKKGNCNEECERKSIADTMHANKCRIQFIDDARSHSHIHTLTHSPTNTGTHSTFRTHTPCAETHSRFNGDDNDVYFV